MKISLLSLAKNGKIKAEYTYILKYQWDTGRAGTISATLKRLQSGWIAGQVSLFPFNALEGKDWGMEEKIQAQQELFGTSLEVQPLELLSEKVANSGAIATIEAAAIVVQPTQH